MEELKFNSRIRNTGNVNVLTVPKAFLKHGLLDHESKYEIVIREIVETAQEASISASDGFCGTLTLDLPLSHLRAQDAPWDVPEAPAGVPA